MISQWIYTPFSDPNVRIVEIIPRMDFVICYAAVEVSRSFGGLDDFEVTDANSGGKQDHQCELDAFMKRFA